MKWFKHFADASNDENMSELIALHGPAAYGVWWIINEIVAKQMDASDKCSARYTRQKWAASCGITERTFIKYLDAICQLTRMEYSADGRFIEIKSPKLLTIRDEYSKKQAKSDEADPTAGNVDIKEALKLYTSVFRCAVPSHNIVSTLEGMVAKHPAEKIRQAFAAAESANAKTINYVMAALEDKKSNKVSMEEGINNI